MTSPGNDFERRVAASGGWPRPPRWTVSPAWLLVLAVGAVGNAWVAVVRWLDGAAFEAVLAVGVSACLSGFFVQSLRRRRQVRGG